MSSEEKLVKMLKYVSEHNDFYKNRIKEYGISNPLDITQWPVLTRKELQESNTKMFSHEYHSNYLTNKLIIAHSSGTSGTPIETYWDPDQYAKSMICLWRRRKLFYDISPTNRHVDFMLKYYNTLPSNHLSYMETGNTISVNRLSLSFDSCVREFFELIQSFQPIWIQLSPSIMDLLINYCLTNNISFPKSIRYVEFLSEVLTISTRKQTEAVLPNAIIANMYGSEEMNAIAYECPCSHMHIVSENVYAECLVDNKIKSEGTGSIILTNLYNNVVPLIRYNQDDIVSLVNESKCTCGIQDKILSDIIGRKSSCATVNGKRLSTCDISDIMLIVSNRYNRPISTYKFIFETKTSHLKCYINLRRHMLGWKESIFTTIRKLFEDRYNNIDIEFILDDLDKPSYKNDLFAVV